MNRRSRLFKYLSIIAFVLIIISFLMLNDKACTVDRVSQLKTPNDYDAKNQLKTPNDYDPKKVNMKVQSDRWIIVDGEEIRKEDLSETVDVPGWTLLVFGENIRKYSNKRCTSCIFIESPMDMADQFSSTPVTNFKMAVYLYVIRHGAKWIYITSKVANLKEDLDDFDFGSRSKGLLYGGNVTFDPDRHFGVKDMSADLSFRNQHSAYTLGDYMTPSIQSRWRIPVHKKRGVDIEYNSCRLPRVFVPPKQYPISRLGSVLIEQRSFWVLGGLMGESSSWTLWWILMMQHLGEVIGIYPPSCSESNIATKHVKIDQDVNKALASLKCIETMTFYECGNFSASELKKRDLFTSSDLKLVKLWFDALSEENFKEPQLQNRQEETFITGQVHKVVFEQVRSNLKIENPLKDACKSIPTSNASATLINDVLLVVIFNDPTYYSNVKVLNYMYKKYFTNILYCGSVLENFSLFQEKYSHPVSFLEINEIERGHYGYMCTAYAMEMGYKVKGYLQMSDDVLLNMWNIRDLPRDRIWFQSSIRKGNLSDPKVPNITPVRKVKTWWPWDSPMGVTKLRSLWAHFEVLLKTRDKPKVLSFLQQLSRSFGKSNGAFYEASDIFYVPAQFQDNFNYFSMLCFSHKLYLEIAIPTMLCGCDDVRNIVRLEGKYFWYGERNITNMKKVYNVKQHFVHPWKLKHFMVHADSRDFFCKKYFTHL